MCEHRRQGKFVLPYTRANKTYQGKVAGKTCSIFTHVRASKATKELVKENLVVCAGLRLMIKLRLHTAINRANFVSW